MGDIVLTVIGPSISNLFIVQLIIAEATR